MFAKQRLYLTAGRDKEVAEGDGRAAFLYATPGDEITASAAERFGLVDGDLSNGRAIKPLPALLGSSVLPAQGRSRRAKPSSWAAWWPVRVRRVV